MLNCELCNYFKTVDLKNSGKQVGVCEFTGFVFQKNVQDYEIEYPCYQEQLNEITAEYNKSEDIDLEERKLA